VTERPTAVATVVLPRSLAALFDGAPRRIDGTGATVDELVRDLDRRLPGLRDRVCTSGGALRPHINVFVDGRPGALETAVADGAVVHILPAVSGG